MAIFPGMSTSFPWQISVVHLLNLKVKMLSKRACLMDIFILHDYMPAEYINLSYFRLSTEIVPRRVFHCLVDNDYRRNLKNHRIRVIIDIKYIDCKNS